MPYEAFALFVGFGSAIVVGAGISFVWFRRGA
jgi:hypothetical protein